MKWKDVKEIIETMTEDELNQDAIVSSDVSSGSIQEFKKSDCEMFLNPDDDYGACLTRKDEIEDYEIEDYEHYYSEGHFIGHF